MIGVVMSSVDLYFTTSLNRLLFTSISRHHSSGNIRIIIKVTNIDMNSTIKFVQSWFSTAVIFGKTLGWYELLQRLQVGMEVELVAENHKINKYN